MYRPGKEWSKEGTGTGIGLMEHRPAMLKAWQGGQGEKQKQVHTVREARLEPLKHCHPDQVKHTVGT